MNYALGSDPGSLGSLAQSARSNELKTARTILFVVGAMTLALNAFYVLQAKPIVDAEIDKEVQVLVAQGMEITMAELDEYRTSAVRATVIMNLVGVGIGFLFVALGMYVYDKPVPITIAGLVIYIGAAAAYGYLDPTTLLRGIVIKIIIVIGLFKAVQAAIASERDQNQTALTPLSPLPSLA